VEIYDGTVTIRIITTKQNHVHDKALEIAEAKFHCHKDIRLRIYKSKADSLVDM